MMRSANRWFARARTARVAGTAAETTILPSDPCTTYRRGRAVGAKVADVGRGAGLIPFVQWTDSSCQF